MGGRAWAQGMPPGIPGGFKAAGTVNHPMPCRIYRNMS